MRTILLKDEEGKQGGQANNPSACQEEGRGRKVMPLKSSTEVRETVRKPRVSRKICLEVPSHRSEFRVLSIPGSWVPGWRVVPGTQK